MSATLLQPAPAREGRSSREVDAFCVEFAPRAPGHPAVRDLQKLLADVPEEGLEARLEWVERCVAWLRESRPALGLVEPAEPEAPAAVTRLALLVRVLEARASSREPVAALVREVMGGTSGLRLFSQVGLPAGQGFFGEVSDRLARHLLPAPPEDHQLSELLLRLFPVPEDAAWLETLPPALLARLSTLVGGSAQPPAREPEAVIRTDLVDALGLLSVQTAALGLSEDVRERCPEVSFRASPFLKLRRVCEGVQARDAAPDSLRELGDVVEECRQVVAIVSSHLEQYGVSVDLVYRLERIRRSLERMEAIARVLGAAPGEARWRESLALVADLLRRAHTDRSVRAVVASNARLLARKVIERAGHSGEHYITSTRAEYHAMVHAAAGGGFITAFTAILKLYAATLALAPFFYGLALAGTYVASFLMMQATGSALATKQPSMTAATLGSAIGQGGSSGRLSHLMELIPRITRSQLATAVGNMGTVLPVAVALSMGFAWWQGRPLLNAAQADYVVHALHPWHSGTIFYAALTGVLLWLSSLVAGWLENFAVYHRLPEAIAHHRALRRALGDSGARKLSDVFAHHIAGLGGNVSIGVLLALPPVVGAFFGLPLDVRHVTLSFGQLCLAGFALGPNAVLRPDFLAALGGIGLTLAINFGVSFSLALAVALRARDVPLSDMLRLVRLMSARFLRDPRSFLLPPRD
ncbi:site-specific recombinase [Vitiosangium sp. GDMCC 1.1324]|uniref:site-specific recombinase n=1 Tax=Vitiosangium sp. (strain GDMCC 1.1324) TaxID=2138576 RepID=UPI000D35460C|nr:site-specific recombinase [Vitiosangium sp. GDMCC 1.1324]PTL81311.1 gliding motility protein [Vitiosangium sp. GDMCC 1.1324]